jgi:hypothetical protein
MPVEMILRYNLWVVLWSQCALKGIVRMGKSRWRKVRDRLVVAVFFGGVTFYVRGFQLSIYEYICLVLAGVGLMFHDTIVRWLGASAKGE